MNNYLKSFAKIAQESRILRWLLIWFLTQNLCYTLHTGSISLKVYFAHSTKDKFSTFYSYTRNTYYRQKVSIFFLEYSPFPKTNSSLRYML